MYRYVYLSKPYKLYISLKQYLEFDSQSVLMQWEDNFGRKTCAILRNIRYVFIFKKINVMLSDKSFKTTISKVH